MTSNKLRINVQKSSQGPSRCGYCHDSIMEHSWTCEHCQAKLHEACYGEFQSCPTLGCAASKTVKIEARARPALGDFQSVLAYVRGNLRNLLSILWAVMLLIAAVTLVIFATCVSVASLIFTLVAIGNGAPALLVTLGLSLLTNAVIWGLALYVFNRLRAQLRIITATNNQ